MVEETPQSSLLGKIAAYTEILQKDPRSTIFVSLSEAYRKMGHLEDARQIVEDGLEIHPDFSPGYIVLARILCQQSDYVASDAAFSKALELDGNSLAGLVGYARLLVLTEEVGKARNLLLKARSLSPADPVINKFLNSLPPAEKEPEEASTGPREISAPLISETLADLYMKQALPDKALEIFRELLRNDPDNLKIRRRIRDAELLMSGGVGQFGVDSCSEETSEEVAPGASDDVLTGSEKEISQEELKTPETGSDRLPDSQEFDVVQFEAATHAASVEAEISPLGVLNQWLENIQKRRKNV